jgi:uncharacterized membrane protein YqaE (UPF0057 family)
MVSARRWPEVPISLWQEAFTCIDGICPAMVIWLRSGLLHHATVSCGLFSDLVAGGSPLRDILLPPVAVFLSTHPDSEKNR